MNIKKFSTGLRVWVDIPHIPFDTASIVLSAAVKVRDLSEGHSAKDVIETVFSESGGIERCVCEIDPIVDVVPVIGDGHVGGQYIMPAIADGEFYGHQERRIRFRVKESVIRILRE